MNINNLNYRPPMTYNEPNKEQENRTMNRTMTREEAIKIINCYDIGFYDLSGAKIPADKLADAFDMAIEALEQEPSEDLISRQDAIDELEYEAEMLNRVLDDMYVVSQEREKFAWGLGLVECFIEDIKELPSVVPTAEQSLKAGKWIVYPLMDEGRVELECPRCGDTFIRVVDYKPHFCENCGARMESDTE